MNILIACIFCPYQTDHINTIIDHTISHLNYQPIKCRICSTRFNSIYDFISHGQFHTEVRDLELEYEPKEVLDEWIRKLYNYLGNDKHLKINEDKSCVICKKYETYFDSIEYKSSLFTLDDCQIDVINEYKVSQNILDTRKNTLKKLTKEQIITIYHVHHHIQYYPFCCTVKVEDKESCELKECGHRFAFIGREFYDHLVKKHDIEFNFENNNSDNFVKAFYIEQLDRMMEKYYVEDRNSKRKH